MNTFKAKRIDFRISIEEAAKKILVSPQVIEDIENNNYQSMPNTFFYYCAKSYASFLEIDLPDIIKKTKPINKRAR
ncbi:helix-turn-helix domain-containing protein [Alphaproteobacteria bacterium]|nr:helix-turn-helix domain-containing protein [Alphaproteobacteria bacterium]